MNAMPDCNSSMEMGHLAARMADTTMATDVNVAAETAITSGSMTAANMTATPIAATRTGIFMDATMSAHSIMAHGSIVAERFDVPTSVAAIIALLAGMRSAV